MKTYFSLEKYSIFIFKKILDLSEILKAQSLPGRIVNSLY